MEFPRYLRIALPPLVLYGAIILAEVLNRSFVKMIGDWGSASAVTAAVVAASIVPIGFVIGGITPLLLSGLERLLKRVSERYIWVQRFRIGYGRYNLQVDDVHTAMLLKDMRMPEEEWTVQARLNVAQTFAHEGTGKWLGVYIGRRWDASMGYCGSIIALIPAAFYVYFRVEPGCMWWWPIAGVMLLFFWYACWDARKEIEEIVRFRIEHRKSIPQAIAQWNPQKAARNEGAQ